MATRPATRTAWTWTRTVAACSRRAACTSSSARTTGCTTVRSRSRSTAPARRRTRSPSGSPGTVSGKVRIATWNVNSLKQRVPRLLPWLDERRPDVVCLQETKLADHALAELLGDELADRGYEIA